MEELVFTDGSWTANAQRIWLEGLKTSSLSRYFNGELSRLLMENGYFVGIGRSGNSVEHSIENVYYVSALKYSLLNVSQICDKGNEVRFLYEKYIFTKLSTNEVILMARRRKNMDLVRGLYNLNFGNDKVCKYYVQVPDHHSSQRI